jgi:hypothetical protein
MNKKFYLTSILIFFIALFCSFASSDVLAETKKVHPYMMFNNIEETPGWNNRVIGNPGNYWTFWETRILNNANTYILRNFSDAVWPTYDGRSYRASYAVDIATAYQITKDLKYALKAKEALYNMDKGSVTGTVELTNSTTLRSYSLVYDFIQPALTPEEDIEIRDLLALLADNCYQRLFHNNAGDLNTGYIAFADFHGQAYPNLAVAGIALHDYTNPNNITLGSGAEDWIKAGTDYLFENDALHTAPNGQPSGRSIISYGFDENSGKHRSGSYKSYVIVPLSIWFQVYSQFYDRNIFDDYPLAKKIIMADLWETLPNYNDHNYGTSGNKILGYLPGFINLFNGDELSYVLNYIYKSKTNIQNNYFSYWYFYFKYQDYSLIERKNPNWTSYLGENNIFQVFRGGWEEDSDWLSFSTNADSMIMSASNRDGMHHDQLGFEYYSHGDLLLADAGENKNVLDKYYGEQEVHHNSFAYENPRNPWAVSTWANSRARAMFKGTSYNNLIVTPVSNNITVSSEWMDIVSSVAEVNNVVDTGISTKKSLSSPISTKRTILYNKEYFVILDSLSSNESWIYRNVFRPTTLNVTNSTGTTEDKVGHVNLNLNVGETPYNWLGLNYKVETSTQISTNLLEWDNGNNVHTKLFTSPSSDVLVTKHVGRIGGYNMPNEVFSPVVYFRTPEQNNLYRATAILSNYSNEEKRATEELSVTGSGSAIKVASSLNEDYIYNGKGNSSFSGFYTDGDSLFLRKNVSGMVTDFTLIDGTHIIESGEDIIRTSSKVNYMTFTIDEGVRSFKVSGNGSTNINISGIDPEIIYLVYRDNEIYGNWNKSDDGNSIIINTTLSEHDFVIHPVNSTPLSIGNVNLKNLSSSSVNIGWVTNENANSLVRYKTSYLEEYEPGNFESNISYVKDHSILLTGLEPNTTYYYVVSSIDRSCNSAQSQNYSFTTERNLNNPPIIQTIGNKNIFVGEALKIIVSATDSDGDNLTYSISGLPTDATFTGNKFSWTPQEIGNYNITFSVNDNNEGIDSETITITVSAPPEDTTAPLKIEDLRITNIDKTRFTLNWTSPHDNNDTGRASSYIIKYSSLTITENNWNNANQFENNITPLSSGTAQSLVVTDLTPNTNYYFAIKSVDANGNISQISNITNAKTLNTEPVSSGGGGGSTPNPPVTTGGGGGTTTIPNNFCTSFTYTEWSECNNGFKERKVLKSSPLNCSGGNPLLREACSVSKENEIKTTQPNENLLLSIKSMDRAQLIELIIMLVNLKNKENEIIHDHKEINNCKNITFNRNLYLGISGHDVKCLQSILNSDKETAIKSTGNGSLGKETYYFGQLTKSAVIKFQEKYAKEVLSPSNKNQGTGYVGYWTILKLKQILP